VPALAVSAEMIIVMTIITTVVIVVPVSMVAVDIDDNRSRITALFVVHRRWRAVYRRIVDRSFVIDRESDPKIQANLSPRITAATQKHECDNNYLLHLILLSGIVGPSYMR
jgi:hypothetical protein